MAQLARLEWTVANRVTGKPVPGALVEVRSQGAQVLGNQAGPVTTINVDSPGGVVAAQTVEINLLGITRSVTSITGTTVIVGAPGFTGLVDDDRIAIVSPLPTLYNDAEGSETKSNPLTTDSNGQAECWIVGAKYDLKVTHQTLTPTLYTDIPTTGGENNRSTIYDSGTGVGWILDTLRLLQAGDKIISVRSAGSEKFYVTGGGVTAVTGNLTVSNQTILSNVLSSTGIANLGTITSTGNISSSGGNIVSDVGNVVATTGDILASAGNLKATVGNLIAKRAQFTRGTVLTTSDFSISAGWGSTATKAINGVAYDTCGEFQVTASGAGIGANPTVTLTYKDGGYPGGIGPNVIATRSDNVSPSTAIWIVSARTTSSCTFAFLGTPTGAHILQYFVVGGTAS